MPTVIVQEPNVTLVNVTEDSVHVAIQQSTVSVSVAQLAGSLSLVSAAADVDMTEAAEGSLLVYRASNQKFEVSNLITVSSSMPSGGQHGDIWFKYTP